MVKKPLEQNHLNAEIVDQSYVRTKLLENKFKGLRYPDMEKFSSLYGQYTRDYYMKTNPKVMTAEALAVEYLHNMPELKDLLNSEDAGEVNKGRILAATVVQLRLAQNNVYSKEPESAGRQDSVEHFLASSHEGFCVHFASAGTLILRSMGVPARYVNGYVVREFSFYPTEAGEFEARVKDSDAHAWCEIYLEDYGWYPIEMTPGLRTRQWKPKDDLISQQYRDALISEPSKTEQATESVKPEELRKELEPEELDSTESKESGKETAAQKKKDTTTADSDTGEKGNSRADRILEEIRAKLWLIIRIIVAIIVTVAIYRSRKYWVKAKVKRLRRDKKYKEAVKYLNRQIYWRLVRKKGVLRELVSDSGFYRALRRYYSDWDWERYREIIDFVSYGKGDITKQELNFVEKAWEFVNKR